MLSEADDMLSEGHEDEPVSALIARLEAITLELEKADHPKPTRRRLQFEDRALRNKLCLYLNLHYFREFFTGRELETKLKLRIIRIVEGIPSKEGKVAANAWMTSRNVSWNGSAPALRKEVLKALNEGQSVPDGYFGLHVDLTVEVGDKMRPTLNKGVRSIRDEFN